MGGHQYTTSSHSTTLESNKSVRHKPRFDLVDLLDNPMDVPAPVRTELPLHLFEHLPQDQPGIANSTVAYPVVL
jgi:hypothetical protein